MSMDALDEVLYGIKTAVHTNNLPSQSRRDKCLHILVLNTTIATTTSIAQLPPPPPSPSHRLHNHHHHHHHIACIITTTTATITITSIAQLPPPPSPHRLHNLHHLDVIGVSLQPHAPPDPSQLVAPPELGLHARFGLSSQSHLTVHVVLVALAEQLLGRVVVDGVRGGGDIFMSILLCTQI